MFNIFERNCIFEIINQLFFHLILLFYEWNCQLGKVQFPFLVNHSAQWNTISLGISMAAAEEIFRIRKTFIISIYFPRQEFRDLLFKTNKMQKWKTFCIKITLAVMNLIVSTFLLSDLLTLWLSLESFSNLVCGSRDVSVLLV